MRRTLEERLAKLERIKAHELQPKKRAVPEWLQELYEADGLVFDSAGQVIGRTTVLPGFESPGATSS
jgi:hypothetical protein